jgi:hypothetical protein
MDHDAFYTFCLFQAQVFPALPSIDGTIYAISVSYTVSRISFTGSQPDYIFIRRSYRQGPYGIHSLIGKQLFKSYASISGFEHAAVCSGDVKSGRIAGDAVNIRYAPAHVGRADGSPF